MRRIVWLSALIILAPGALSAGGSNSYKTTYVNFCVGWRMDAFVRQYLWFRSSGVGCYVDVENFGNSGEIYSYWRYGDWLTMHAAPEWQQRAVGISICPTTMHNRCVRGMSCRLVKNKNGSTSLKAEGKAVGPNVLSSVKPPLAVRRVWTDLWENELTKEQRQMILTRRDQSILVESKSVPPRRRLEGLYESQPLSGKLSRSQEWLRGAVEFIEFVNNSRGTFVYHGFTKEGELPTRCLYYYRCQRDRFGIYIGVNDQNDHQLIRVEEGTISKDGNTVQLLSKDVDAIRLGCFPLNRTLCKVAHHDISVEEREKIGIPKRGSKIIH